MGDTGGKLIAIGEALIDLVPDGEKYIPAVGGAPANVAAAFAKLGGRASLITQVGKDRFGEKITEKLNSCGVDTSMISVIDKANTGLSVVFNREDGDREFCFYRNPSADMLYTPEQLKKEWFADCFALHYGSLSLAAQGMKEAHKKAIEFARENGAIISFDINLRPALWGSKEEMLSAVRKFLPCCDILKLSEDELWELTAGGGETVSGLFVGNVKMIMLTLGKGGARVFTKDKVVSAAAVPCKAVDTTGAGDGCIAAFLRCLSEEEVSAKMLAQISCDKIKGMLEFSQRFCAVSVMARGAIDSYPTAEKMGLFRKDI